MQVSKSPDDRQAKSLRDFTRGSIIRNLLTLSWPMIVTNSLTMAGPTIDLIWVGKLGTAAIAGVGAAGMGLMIIMPAMMGLSMAARALIARSIGAGNYRDAAHIARQAFILSMGISLIVAIIGIFFSESILRLLGMQPDVVEQGGNYLRIVFTGSGFIACQFVAEGIMQASGDSITPMKISIAIRIFHLILSPTLVLGWWIFPRMGTSGAALTNITTQALGLSLGLWVLFTGRTRIRLNLENFRIDTAIIWRMVRIGLPALIAGLAQPFAMTILIRIIASYGTQAVATLSLVQRIQMIVTMPAMALGIAAGVLAGQNLGARQPERAEKSGWMAAAIAEVIMVGASLVIFFWVGNIVGIFSKDPGLIDLTSTFLKITLAGYLFMGVMALLMNCLQGVGDTIPPMIVNLVIMWIIQIPLAILLPKVTSLRFEAIPWSMVAGQVLGAIFFLIYFRAGRWKRKKI
jgi:putative MATE family efflux protein